MDEKVCPICGAKEVSRDGYQEGTQYADGSVNIRFVVTFACGQEVSVWQFADGDVRTNHVVEC